METHRVSLIFELFFRFSENHSGMETNLQLETCISQLELSENHSGMETVHITSVFYGCFVLSENHSGMETCYSTYQLELPALVE